MNTRIPTPGSLTALACFIELFSISAVIACASVTITSQSDAPSLTACFTTDSPQARRVPVPLPYLAILNLIGLVALEHELPLCRFDVPILTSLDQEPVLDHAEQLLLRLIPRADIGIAHPDYRRGVVGLR